MARATIETFYGEQPLGFHSIVTSPEGFANAVACMLAPLRSGPVRLLVSVQRWETEERLTDFLLSLWRKCNVSVSSYNYNPSQDTMTFIADYPRDSMDAEDEAKLLALITTPVKTKGKTR